MPNARAARATLRLRDSITGRRKPCLQAFSALVPRKRSVALASSFLQFGGTDNMRPLQPLRECLNNGMVREVAQCKIHSRHATPNAKSYALPR